MARRRRKNRTAPQVDTKRDLQQCLVERRAQWKIIIDQVFREPDLLRDLMIWMAYAESGCPQLFTRWKADLGPGHLKLHDSLHQLGVAKGSAVVVINAFVGWQTTPKRERPMWCNRRCLNTDSLRKIDRALKNILAAVKAQTHQNFEFKWEECQMTEERHKKWHPVLLWWGGIWFCVYLGHSKLGYLNCDSGTKFHISHDDVHLNSLPYLPNYIVPIPTSSNPSENRTVLNMIVDDDRVMFLQKRWSPRLMFWLNSASKHVVAPLSVSTGVTVIYQLQKTDGFGTLGNELTKAFKTPVWVEINETKSEIVLYCAKRIHTKASSVLLRLIESLQASIESLPTKLPYPEGEADSPVKLLMGAGALIHETDTHDGVENMAMLYVRAFNKKRKELDASLTEDYVMARLTQDGFDASHVVKSNDFPRSSHWGSVMFAEYINHAAVSEELKSQGHLHCKWVRSNDLYPKSLVVNFSVERRTLQQNVVCVKVATDRHLEKMKTVDWAKRINATADYCGKKEVKMTFKTSYWNFHGLRKDIEKWSGVRVAEMKHDYAAAQATTADDLREMEAKIREAIKDHLDDFKKTEVRIDEPGADDTEFKGRITLSDGNSRNFHGYDLEDDLENVRLRGKPVWTDGIDEVYELTVSLEAYKVLQREINSELRKMTRDSICRDNSITETQDSVVISIRWFFTDNDPPREVKNFAALLEPSVVVGVDSRLISGREKLDSLVKIERSTKTFIDVDRVYRQASIYGSDANKKKARAKLTKLMAEVHSCKNMAVEVSVPLEGEMLPKGLALEVVRRHGVGLELATKTGCDSVELDTKCRTLNCKGNVPNIDALLREIEDCSQQLTRRESSLFVRSSDCCSCFTEVTADSLRLENCGHLFCMECLALQIQTYMEAKRFPISCAAEACETCISVCDILTICNRNSIELARLIACSLNCHLARNRHRVRPCPTTDCPMFYNVTADPEEFICPKCKKALCSACHEPFHTGLSCDIKREIECLEDKKLKSWIQEQPKKRKMCPKCKSGIEKQMGCSNVHCASCHTYICWLCLKTFKESGDAYAHIDARHTRRGENDWDEIDDVMNEVELEAAEVARVAQNRAAAVAAAVRDAAGGGAGGAALLQNGVGVAPAENNNNPIDPERLQAVQNQMQRLENRLQEVERAGQVQPHRLHFLRAELEDIRDDMRVLEERAGVQQGHDQNEQNARENAEAPEEKQMAGQAEGGDNANAPIPAPAPPAPEPAGPRDPPEEERRVLRPRRGGVAAVGRHAAPQEPAAPANATPAQQPQEVDANNIQNHIDNYNATVRAEAELEQLEARVLQAAPRDLRGGEGGDADADLNELLDRLNNEGQAQLNGLLGLALPPRPRANPNALEQPLQHVRPFRQLGPGQLQMDVNHIVEELDDLARMMERIAGAGAEAPAAGAGRRPEAEADPPRPPPLPPRPLNIGAIFERLHRQAVEDGDPEIRLRLPFHRPLRRLIHGEIVPPLPPADEVEPAPRLAPLDLAEPREPPWMLRRVLRPRRNGVAPGNMEQEFVGNANEDEDVIRTPLPATDAASTEKPMEELTVDVNHPDQDNNRINPDVQEINNIMNPAPGPSVNNTEAGDGDQPNNPEETPNINAAAVEDNAAPAILHGDVVIRNANIPQPVRVQPLGIPGQRFNMVPVVQPIMVQLGEGDWAQDRGGNAHRLPDIMPVFRAQPPANPLIIRRAPQPPDLNVDGELFVGPPRAPLPPIPFPPPRVLPPPIPFPRLERQRPERRQHAKQDDFGTQIQQIIASVQAEHVAVPTPGKCADKDSKQEAEPQPSTSTGGETSSSSRSGEADKAPVKEESDVLAERKEEEEHSIDSILEVVRMVREEVDISQDVTMRVQQLQIQVQSALKKLSDLRERINSDNLRDLDVAKIELEREKVLLELETHKRDAMLELKQTLIERKNKKMDESKMDSEPQPGTSAQTAHEATPPSGHRDDSADDGTLAAPNGTVRGETAAHGAGQEAAVARRAWTALRQAAGDAERDGDWEANADGVGHVLTTRDGLLAKDQISQRIEEMLGEEPEKREPQRSGDEPTGTTAARQAALRTEADASVRGAEAEPGPLVRNANVRVMHDQTRQQRLLQLLEERDAEMTAIKAYTNQVLDQDDLSSSDLIEMTESVNLIIRTQDFQQRELLHGISEILTSGADAEQVRARIEEAMARYYEEEERALHRMRVILQGEAEPTEAEPGQDSGPARALRPRRGTESETTPGGSSSSDADQGAATKESAVNPPEETNGQSTDKPKPGTSSDEQTEVVSTVLPFREGLVRHLSRLVQLNREMRQEILALNVSMIDNIPIDRRLVGMLYVPQFEVPTQGQNEEREAPHVGNQAIAGLDAFQGWLAVRTPVVVEQPRATAAEAAAPGSSAWEIPMGPRMERRGAIVEADMKHDVKTLQTQQSITEDEPQPSTSAQGLVSNTRDSGDGHSANQSESDSEPEPKRRKIAENPEPSPQQLVVKSEVNDHQAENQGETEEKMDEAEAGVDEPEVQVRQLRNRVLVLNEDAQDGRRRGRRGTVPAAPAAPAEAHRRRPRASDPGPQPPRRARRH